MSKSVYFLFFTEANSRLLMPLLHPRSGWQSTFVPAFDFERHRFGQKMWYPDGIRTKTVVELDVEGAVPSPLAPPQTDLEKLVHLWFQRHDSFGLVKVLEAIECSLRKELRDAAPELVVLPEETDYARGRLASLVLREFPQIKKSVLFPPYYHLFESYPLCRQPAADSYIIGSAAMGDALAATGVLRDRVCLAGFPFTKKARPNTFPKRLLFLMQGQWMEQRVLEDCVWAATRLSYELLVKPHPACLAETRGLLARFLDHASVREVPAKSTLSDVLPEVGAVVAQSSSGFFEALAAGVPVFAAHYQMGPYRLRLKQDGKWVHVFSTAENLAQALACLDVPREAAPVVTAEPEVYAERVWGHWERVVQQ